MITYICTRKKCVYVYYTYIILYARNLCPRNIPENAGLYASLIRASAREITNNRYTVLPPLRSDISRTGSGRFGKPFSNRGHVSSARRRINIIFGICSTWENLSNLLRCFRFVKIRQHVFCLPKHREQLFPRDNYCCCRVRIMLLANTFACDIFEAAFIFFFCYYPKDIIACQLMFYTREKL